MRIRILLPLTATALAADGLRVRRCAIADGCRRLAERLGVLLFRPRSDVWIFGPDQTPNARYGRMMLRIWTASNGLLLIVVSAGLWFFAARANSHGIPPNTSLGFRSQQTLASLHGW